MQICNLNNSILCISNVTNFNKLHYFVCLNTAVNCFDCHPAHIHIQILLIIAHTPNVYFILMNHDENTN